MNKLFFLIVSLLLSTTANAAVSQCENLACVFNALTPQLESFEPVLDGLCYIFGIVLGIRCVLKLKDMSESKGQIKLTQVVILFIASGLFIALPSLIHTGATALSLPSNGAIANTNY